MRHKGAALQRRFCRRTVVPLRALDSLPPGPSYALPLFTYLNLLCLTFNFRNLQLEVIRCACSMLY